MRSGAVHEVFDESCRLAATSVAVGLELIELAAAADDPLALSPSLPLHADSSWDFDQSG